jgi:putative ABC transport system permease protein
MMAQPSFHTGSQRFVGHQYASVLVWDPVAPGFEAAAMTQFRTAIANRQHFSPSDKRAITMFGREEFKPVMEGITIGIEALLFFVGSMTLGIGGVGVMNIMLVSVEERVREIGLRRALGARKSHIRWQFLLEALVMTIAAGAIGMVLSWDSPPPSALCHSSAPPTKTNLAKWTSTSRCHL